MDISLCKVSPVEQLNLFAWRLKVPTESISKVISPNVQVLQYLLVFYLLLSQWSKSVWDAVNTGQLMNTWFVGATSSNKALGGPDCMWGVRKEEKLHMENLSTNDQKTYGTTIRREEVTWRNKSKFEMMKMSIRQTENLLEERHEPRVGVLNSGVICRKELVKVL